MKNSTLRVDIKSMELTLVTEEEIALALGKKRVKNIKRISIRKGEETNTDQHLNLAFS